MLWRQIYVVVDEPQKLDLSAKNAFKLLIEFQMNYIIIGTHEKRIWYFESILISETLPDNFIYEQFLIVRNFVHNIWPSW